MSNFFDSITQSGFWQYAISHFGWVDWLLLGFVFVGVLIGLRHGMSQELPRFLEILISLFVTLEYYPVFAEWLARETPWAESYLKVFAFALLGIVSWLILRLLFGILGRFVRLEVAAPFQSVGGTLMGGVRYFLIFSMLSYFLILFPLDFLQRSYRVQSWSGQILIQMAPKIHGLAKRFWVSKEVL